MNEGSWAEYEQKSKSPIRDLGNKAQNPREKNGIKTSYRDWLV